MMDRREAAALDRYITGNYGEDQFKNEEYWDTESAHFLYWDNHRPMCGVYGVYDSYDPADDGPECEVITRILARYPLYRLGQESELLRFQQYLDRVARAMYGERFGRLGSLRKMKVTSNVIRLHLGLKVSTRLWNSVNR